MNNIKLSNTNIKCLLIDVIKQLCRTSDKTESKSQSREDLTFLDSSLHKVAGIKYEDRDKDR